VRDGARGTGVVTLERLRFRCRDRGLLSGPRRAARTSVVEKEIPVKKLFFSLTAAAWALSLAGEASAQYNPYAQQATRQAPAAQAHYAPQQAYPQQGYSQQGYRQPGYQQSGYAVQPVSTAMRPGTTTYAGSPAVGLKPVNPPSAATQRILMASRTGTNVSTAQNTAPAKQPVAPPQQYWNSGMNASPWEPSQGASYGAPQGSPQGAAYGAPQADAVSGGGAVGGQCGGDQCGGDCGHSCGHCGCLHGWLHSGCLLHSTGDLVQHMPHFGTTHGYYYFRPYHVMHVFSQQELVTRWGGDPRNPYDNTMFQNVYQQLGVDAATVKARAEQAAKDAQAANQAAQEYVVPTPLPNYPTAPQYVPGSEHIIPPGVVPQGAIPQGMPMPPTPAVEYVPGR